MNKEPIYQQYLKLPEDLLKLLCFMAYTGRRLDDDAKMRYQKTEGLSKTDFKRLKDSIKPYTQSDIYNSYYGYYILELDRYTPLLLYMVETNLPLLVHLGENYSDMPSSESTMLLDDIKCCVEGSPLNRKRRNVYYTNTVDEIRILTPLASDIRFLPMFEFVRDKFSFVQSALVHQMVNDICDPDYCVSKVADFDYKRMSAEESQGMKSLVALYDFFRYGRFDKAAAKAKNIYGYILSAAKALYDGEYAEAFNNMVLAIRIINKQAYYRNNGFFARLINNYLLVLAYYLYKDDKGRKLSALLNKSGFVENYEFIPALWMTNYFTSGRIPYHETVETFISRYGITKVEKYFALLVAHFSHLQVKWPDDLPKVPNMMFLRQELSPWLPIDDSERSRLHEMFGGEPLLSRIHFKQQWELLLEELTPSEEQVQSKVAKSTRICYIITSYSSIEIREQTRLRSGAWGVGKSVSLRKFKEGLDSMDDKDRRFAAEYDPWDNESNFEKLLSLFVGSDRVATGVYAPLKPVTIAEEKPYLVIERTNKGFKLKSNVTPNTRRSNIIYRKDSETHYTVIKINKLQLLYYQKLLSVGVFPLEAEQQLREFLPKVSEIVEVHSELVEGGSTLEQREGSPLLCLQVMPHGGTPNCFDVWCMARPLVDGKTFLEAGSGMNPCVAEQDGVRYQVTRDIKGERANLLMLRTFFSDNDLDDTDSDELFADRTPAFLDLTALLMLIDFVRQHPDSFYMEWPEGGQLNLKTAQPSSWNVSLQSKNGWFEVEGEIPIDDETVLTVGELLKLASESPRTGFIRLNDTDYMAISDRLRKQLARLESLAISNRGHLQISELHASLLGSALNGELKIKHDKRLEQLQKKIEKSMALTPATPTALKAELRDYQTDGFQWMARMTGWGAGVCLADDMGLGKTVQTIAFLLHTSDQGAALVAAPASVVLNWRRELTRFAPMLHVEVLNEAADRKALVEKAAAGDVILTSYGLFVNEDESICSKEWNTVCLDEAHVIKNRQTKTSAVVMRLKATNRIILTGTPVQNHLGELWNLFQFANPGLLGSHEQFRQKYIIPIEQLQNKERSGQLKRIVGPFMLRRTKQEVVEELPDKTEINLPVELNDEEMAIYELIRRKAKKMLEEESSGSGVSVNTLAEITRLRQAACSAELVEKKWKGECSKINALSDLLQEIVDGGNSVLVFSQFTSFLSLVRERLDKQGCPYYYLDGSVPVHKRDELVQQFQHGQCPVFLISLKAGGLGLNLTGANYVIHLDPWWNPAIEQQATDRAYRIGQRQNVTVYHLISMHTIEEKILRLHQTKRNLADAMLAGTNESHKLTSKDLLAMIDSGTEQ